MDGVVVRVFSGCPRHFLSRTLVVVTCEQIASGRRQQYPHGNTRRFRALRAVLRFLVVIFRRNFAFSTWHVHHDDFFVFLVSFFLVTSLPTIQGQSRNTGAMTPAAIVFYHPPLYHTPDDLVSTVTITPSIGRDVYQHPPCLLLQLMPT